MADRTNFVTDQVKKTVDVANLAAALMRHVAQLVSNAHAVTRVERTPNGKEFSETRMTYYVIFVTFMKL